MKNAEIVKWLQSLKSEIGKQRNQHLWNYEEALDMAIKTLQEDEWISASDRLPDKDELVLVTDSGSIEFGKLIDGLFGDLWLIWLDSCWEEATKVTAWMPLPGPYKAEDEKK